MLHMELSFMLANVMLLVYVETSFRSSPSKISHHVKVFMWIITSAKKKQR